ncbi:MAG: hypothetical protein BAJALOKI1v1_1390009 [Promethearchaeota archaeon]|nr:MAG: hypothetical protein BAJALOKI1v1_1390009 [Candidatus Lokiarchaeota archaeon]
MTCKNQIFIYTHRGHIIDREVQTPITIAEMYIGKKLTQWEEHKDVASPISAEKQLMKTALGELRELIDFIIREISQIDKVYIFI